MGLLALVVASGASFGAMPVEAGEVPRWSVQIEGGAVCQTRNDVQIPNAASATRFSLRDLAGTGAWPAGRVYLEWRAGERHALRALFAPLSITETGVPDRPIAFASASLIMPFAIPLAVSAGASVPLCVAAVITGGTFGDVTSPVAGMTNMASNIAHADHAKYLRYAAPYNLAAAGIAAVLYVVAGLVSGGPQP